jgi:hypothetical protein
MFFVDRGLQRRTGGKTAIGFRGVGHLISIINLQSRLIKRVEDKLIEQTTHIFNSF